MLKKNRYDIMREVTTSGFIAIKPSESIGWPPGLEDYIHAVVFQAINATINAIYTEEEMDEKVERIMLTDENEKSVELK